jgi:hypothetical protein
MFLVADDIAAPGLDACPGWLARRDAADPAGEPAWVARSDRAPLLGQPHVRADGTLLVEGFAAKAGVMEYRTRDGKVFRELVPEETLRASAHGLGRATVTLHHPDGDVTPENVGDLGVGDTDGEVRVEDGGYVRVRLAVRRSDAIRSIRSGKTVELSPGYLVRLDPTPGEHPVHGRYDAVQVERRYNHLALVDVARGGHDVRLRADSAAVMVDPIAAAGRTTSTPEARMNAKLARILALLGVTAHVDNDDAAIDQITATVEGAAKARKDADDKAAADLKTAQDALAAKTAELDASKAENERLKADAQAKADAAEVAELLPVATVLKVDGADKLALPELRKAVARAHLGKDLRADAGDAYVAALVDLAKTAVAERGAGRADGAKVWTDLTPPAAKNDAKDETPPATRADSWTRNQNEAFKANKGAA